MSISRAPNERLGNHYHLGNDPVSDGVNFRPETDGGLCRAKRLVDAERSGPEMAASIKRMADTMSLAGKTDDGGMYGSRNGRITAEPCAFPPVRERIDKMLHLTPTQRRPRRWTDPGDKIEIELVPSPSGPGPLGSTPRIQRALPMPASRGGAGSAGQHVETLRPSAVESGVVDRSRGVEGVNAGTAIM